MSESRPAGYVLPLILSVIDLDSGPNGDTECTIEPALYLNIHDCNTVTLVKPLDYEQVKLLQGVISAMDHGSPPLTR